LTQFSHANNILTHLAQCIMHHVSWNMIYVEI